VLDISFCFSTRSLSLRIDLACMGAKTKDGNGRERDLLRSSVAPDFMYAQALAVRFRFAASCLSANLLSHNSQTVCIRRSEGKTG